MVMRCFGSFLDDRTCDLCGVTARILHSECRAERERRAKVTLWKARVRRHCPHAEMGESDRTLFAACNRNGRAGGRFGEDCRPDETCPQPPEGGGA